MQITHWECWPLLTKPVSINKYSHYFTSFHKSNLKYPVQSSSTYIALCKHLKFYLFNVNLCCLCLISSTCSNVLFSLLLCKRLAQTTGEPLAMVH